MKKSNIILKKKWKKSNLFFFQWKKNMFFLQCFFFPLEKQRFFYITIRDSALKMASASFFVKRQFSSETKIAEEEKSSHSSPRLSNSNLFRFTWAEHRSCAGQAELTTAHIMRVVNFVVPTLPSRRNRPSPSCAARN